MTTNIDWLNDAGLHYGYGGFETLHIAKGRLLFVDQHLARFRAMASFLKILVPWSDHEILNQANEQLAQSDIQEGVMKWLLTAGERQDNFRFKDPKLVITVRSLPEQAMSKSVSLKIQKDPFSRSQWDAYKTLNYAKPIWHKQHLAPGEEFLLTTETGELLEATTSNVFLIKGNQLLTPDHPYVLRGVMRQHVLNHAMEKWGIMPLETTLTVDDYLDAEGCFLTNVVSGIRWDQTKQIALDVDGLVAIARV